MGCENIMPELRKEKLERCPCDGNVPSGPFKEGRVRMVQQAGSKSITVHVNLKLYSNNYDTYAVISMDKALCKDFGYISLKNCSVKRVQSDDSKHQRNGFQIQQRKLDLDPVTFYVSDSREVDRWMAAVTENTPGQAAEMPDLRRPLLSVSGLTQRTSRPRSRSGSSSSRPGSLLLPALEEEGAKD